MDPYRAPPPLPTLPTILAQLYLWLVTNWRSSLGAIGVVAECAAQYATRYGGPSWMSYGHVVFGVLCVAGFVSAGDAKKVADLQTSITQMRALVGLPPGTEGVKPPGPPAMVVDPSTVILPPAPPAPPAMVPVVPDLDPRDDPKDDPRLDPKDPQRL